MASGLFAVAVGSGEASSVSSSQVRSVSAIGFQILDFRWETPLLLDLGGGLCGGTFLGTAVALGARGLLLGARSSYVSWCITHLAASVFKR